MKDFFFCPVFSSPHCLISPQPCSFKRMKFCVQLQIHYNTPSLIYIQMNFLNFQAEFEDKGSGKSNTWMQAVGGIWREEKANS